MIKKNGLILINPVSGGFSKGQLKKDLASKINAANLNIEIAETKSAEESAKLASEAVQNHFEMVVAVGGDGTISQIARILNNTETALGIIPAGSGNGYARSLGIPLNHHKAIQVINRARMSKVDTGTMNGKTFVNVAGVGFDAHVAASFHHSVKRGFLTYARIALTEFQHFQLTDYEIESERETFQEQAFLISICLGSQYGNNAFIAPLADLRDGLFHATIIRNASLGKIPGIILKLFNKSIRESKNIGVVSAASFRIKRPHSGAIHLDGDPFEAGTDLEFSISPLSLKVII